MNEMPGGEPAIARVTRSKQQAQATYDRISRWYDLLEGVWEARLRRAGLRRLDVQDAEVALEIGFGPGHSLEALARAVGDSGRVYGVDLSPRMNDSARQRISRAGLADRVELHCGDALRLPAGWGSVDAIFMSFTLELFDTPEIPQVLRECLRVLRPDGRICVVSLSKAGGTNWMRSLYEWGHETFPAVLDCRPIFVQRSLEEAGLQTAWSTLASLWGLPVEIVLASKP